MRIAVTTIELFRNYLNGSIELSELLNNIEGKAVPNRYMQLGTAFHDIIANLEQRYISDRDVFRASNGIEFNSNAILRCYEKIIKEAIPEVKLSKIYKINGEAIEVVAKVDQLYGNYVIENKTCWGGFNYDKYYESYQWRYYLDVFEADKVFYNIFCFYDLLDEIELVSIEQFSFDKYKNLQRNINILLTEFVNFIHKKNLEQYFNQI